jgi:hypothetical protein
MTESSVAGEYFEHLVEYVFSSLQRLQARSVTQQSAEPFAACPSRQEQAGRTSSRRDQQLGRVDRTSQRARGVQPDRRTHTLVAGVCRRVNVSNRPRQLPSDIHKRAYHKKPLA